MLPKKITNHHSENKLKMEFSELKLPTNRKFGFFFFLVFLLVSIYFYSNEKSLPFYIFFIISFLFLIITIIKDKLLLPLNKMWMKLGLLLGRIVSPIILGIMFFALFTPVAFVLKLFKRDELQLQFNKNKISYWTLRKTTITKDSFKLQF